MRHHLILVVQVQMEVLQISPWEGLTVCSLFRVLVVQMEVLRIRLVVLPGQLYQTGYGEV